jgi:hypothetical protein
MKEKQMSSQIEEIIDDPKVTAEMRDAKTPLSVKIQSQARKPYSDPTLGINPELSRKINQKSGNPRNRLVTIGDSLTHGFQSGAIFHTDISYPRMIAWEMGCDQYFRYPTYNGYGGLPLNLEWIIRNLEHKYGDKIDKDIWKIGAAAFEIKHLLDEVQSYWERGAGDDLSYDNLLARQDSKDRGVNHNLAVYGWAIQDIHRRTASSCEYSIQHQKSSDDWLFPIVKSANPRAALRVLDAARDADGKGLTPLQAAEKLGKQGTWEDSSGDGIETLIIFIGANNALGSILEFSVRWSTKIYEDLQEYDNLRQDQKFTVWDPIHFKKELDLVVDQVRQIRARHVIFATVPHVTIAPLARGVGNKVRPGSRYFPYYTYPWISDENFNSKDDPSITEQEARAIDSAIDQYNYDIAKAVESARLDNLDWYLIDIAGILDRLAARRYFDDHSARPDWWTPYDLPAALQNLSPVPDARFFKSDSTGRISGGLFALDGVHPTTIGYAVLAQEFINIMQQYAGVEFYLGDGKTKRNQPVRVDFQHWISHDNLIIDPPISLTEDLEIIGWINKKLDMFKCMLSIK